MQADEVRRDINKKTKGFSNYINASKEGGRERGDFLSYMALGTWGET